MMIEIRNTAKPKTAPRSRAQRKRAAAEATARWRNSRQSAGMPEAQVVDRAISEAAVFCMRPRFALRDGDDSVYISINRLFRVAMLILVKNGADRELAQQAVKQRLSPRKAHNSPRNVPSTTMCEAHFAPTPRRKELDWNVRDIESMRKAATPLEITAYDGVTGVSSQIEDHYVSRKSPMSRIPDR